MITYLNEADPDKPFFSYLSFQAIHFPVQVGSEYRDRYGRFDEGLGRAMRARRLERAIALGLVPEGTVLAPLPASSRNWTDLSEDEQAYWARAMQVNAGMLGPQMNRSAGCSPIWRQAGNSTTRWLL